MIFRNVAGQKLPLYLQDSSGNPQTGQAANITAYISVDGGTPQQVTPVTEIGGGYYYISPSQAQTDGHLIVWWGTHASYICRGGAGFTSDTYTQIRATKLDNLDATVSSRLAAEDYVVPPSTGAIASAVWNQDNRTLTAFAFNVNLNMDQALPANPTANSTGEALKFADTRLDAAVSSRADGSAYTPARAAKLDNLDVAVSSRSTLTDSQVWSYSSRTLTSSVDVNMSQGLPASPSPNTVGEALKFADTRLDATVSSRSSHAPADVWNYSTRTLTSSVTISMDQTLPATPSANTVGEALKFADTRLDVTVGSRLAAYSYVAPDNTSIAAIKTQTDRLRFDSQNNVYAAVSGIEINAEDVAAAIWDVGMSEHNIPGSAGAKLNVIEARTANITAGTEINVVQPVAQDQTLTLVRGDDYSAADGRALQWTGYFPDLTGSIITFTIASRRDYQAIVQTTCTAAPGTDGAWTITAELTSTQTSPLNPNDTSYVYDVEAIIDSRHVTLVRGRVEVLPDANRT